jgi:putative transposase
VISTQEREKAIILVQDAVKVGARQRKACEILRISERTLQRWQMRTPSAKEDQRCHTQRVPANKLSTEEKQKIINICNSEKYKGLSPCQIVPTLLDNDGIYMASESSFYRFLHEHGQLTHRGKRQVSKRNKPKGYTATGPNQVWTWDITYLPAAIKGVFYYLYMITDIYSRKVVAWEVHDNQSDDLASQLMKRAYLSEGVSGKEIVLHSDNGSPMKGATMLSTLQHLGVIPSFSRPSVSNDNPYSEALFKTLKYTPIYPSKPFDTIDVARTWVLKFERWYNNHHRHSGIKFVTPNDRHTGVDKMILENRKKIYLKARERTPERWSGNIRNWDLIKEVTLNPEHSKDKVIEKAAS